jgi:hypothetical protein
MNEAQAIDYAYHEDRLSKIEQTLASLDAMLR